MRLAISLTRCTTLQSCWWITEFGLTMSSIELSICGLSTGDGPKTGLDWSSFWNLVWQDIPRRIVRTKMPKSPEPTAVGAGRTAVAVHVASQRWLSFLGDFHAFPKNRGNKKPKQQTNPRNQTK